MSFENPWVLLFLVAPLAWAAWESRRTDRRGSAALVGAAFALVVVACAEPVWELRESEVAVAVLTDASGSTPADQLEAQAELVDRIRAAADGSPVRLLQFNAGVRRGLAGEESGEASSTALGTDLETAVRSGLAALPADRVGRLALASDGMENVGSVERAAYQARERGVPIDVFPLSGRARPDLRIASASVPAQAFIGERFPIEIAVESPREAPAEISLEAEGRAIGTSNVTLRPGENLFRVRARLDQPGAALIRGRVAAVDLGEAVFSGVVRLAEPRALLLQRLAEGEEPHLADALQAARFEVTRAAAPPAGDLRESFDLVIVDNLEYEKWPDAQKRRFESYVSAGGGLLVVSGENNLYVERDDPSADPFNRALPATLAPPRTAEGAVVVLVLDKSSSMEGRKMELARQSAMGVVDNLRPVDRVGVLAFDNSFQWAVPVRENENPAAIKRLIGGIIADGGTQIAPALSEGYRVIQPQRAPYRHILLLTDGISEEGDSMRLAREAASQQITISTIGLGQDVNRAFLERVASNAKGRSYLVVDVNQLAEVVLRDVLEHTGTSVTEREVYPRVAREADVLDGVDFRQAGPLLGWVQYEAKPSAETLLEIEEEEVDPLFVRWQYGLGRSAVFASDAKNRWAANWIDAPLFDRLWANIARDLLPRAQTSTADVRFDPAAQQIVVSYQASPTAEEEPPTEVFVLGPEGFRAVAPLVRTGPDRYEARAGAAGTYGLFRIRPERATRDFPELAYLRENSELTAYGSNPELLATLAAATGGRVSPEPEALFASDGRSLLRRMELWPFALALALLLSLTEVVIRKGWFPWSRSA